MQFRYFPDREKIEPGAMLMPCSSARCYRQRLTQEVGV
jgi:hypothetical protein